MDLEIKAGRKNAQLVEKVQVSVLIGKICRFSRPRLITWYHPPSMSSLRGLAAERNVKGYKQHSFETFDYLAAEGSSVF
jgi:hypothetical protein